MLNIYNNALLNKYASHDLRSCAEIPEHCPENQSYEGREQESHSSVRWVTPV